jgi:membrane-bound metal-dependent hydrolase YbcI (DUF457 family)
MDTITHGIAGALIGKAFFDGEDLLSQRPGTGGRAVTIAATLGAIFPDSDIVRDVLSRDPLLILTWHRGPTHSLLLLPIFALILAAVTRWALTRWGGKRFGADSPRFATLLLIYGVAIASHILLDLVTSYGTMAWWPASRTRVAWDLIFIIDFTLTAILLLPQFIARLYGERQMFSRRALRLWMVFCLGAALAGWLLTLEQFAPTTAGMLAAIVAMALMIFVPAYRGWGFRVRLKSWSLAGVLAGSGYIMLAATAHHAALGRVQQFAAHQQMTVENLGALPLPPSFANWDGLIRTPRGVYEFRLSLWECLTPKADDPIEYNYYPDTPQNEMLAAARQLREVQNYLWFARFPVFRWHTDGANTVVEFADLRFFQRRGRSSFTYQVIFDGNGKVVRQGWLKN